LKTTLSVGIKAQYLDRRQQLIESHFAQELGYVSNFIG